MSEHLAGCALEPVTGPTLCRSSRRIVGRVRPTDAAAVAAVVKECAERGLGLHPISTGKNWGLGSFLPARDDVVLLDLSALNTIGPLDRAAATVRIEPGVTQTALYQWLKEKAPELAFNVTGSGQDTSLLGNALERGLGYGGSRAGELFGLEVVLADGTWHRPESAWFSPTGMAPAGPQLDALFAQANYGIVAAACLRLRRRQEMEAAIIISGELDPVFELVRAAFQRNLFTLPVHLAGGQRTARTQAGLLRSRWGREPSAAEVQQIFPAKISAQNAIAAVHGQTGVVRATLRELHGLAGGGVRLQILTAGRLDFAERWCRRFGLNRRAEFIGAVRPLVALTWGVPSDAGLAPLDFSDKPGDPDYAATGCIYLNAVTTNELSASCEAEKLMTEAWADSALTRNFVSAGVLVHVMGLNFSSEQGEEAHRAARALGESLRRAGFPPYRLGAATMGDGVPGELAHRLKAALDVRGLIAPGSYVA